MQGLLIAKRLKRFCVRMHARCQKLSDFFDQPALENSDRAGIQARVKQVARGIESQLDRSETAEGSTSLPEERGNWLSFEHADFQRPDGLVFVVGMDARGSGRVQARENTMQTARPSSFSELQ